MATAEADTSRDEQVPPGGSVYDGFISYSHAADDLLAPRLQAGLQRFAKAWWKRRALRIFRDESSLSANPHLWSSITDALDGSGWFVLLLSPDAAESQWVNQEVEYWLEYKDPDRIIPVLTDGEFSWADGDVSGDAVPPALAGSLADEPRWVDLRFARTEEQLDLQNPEFSAAVADIASAIRGIPKDELASEEVRQHRRTVRTAWGAGAVVALLALLAGGAAIFAFSQQNRADAEAAFARSRELTASSVAALDTDPDLAVLLALEATEAAEPDVQTISALRAAISEQRTLHYFEWNRTIRPGTTAAALSPDGTLIAMHAQANYLEVRDLLGDPTEPIWSVDFPRPEGTNLAAAFTDDGSQLVVSIGWWPEGDADTPVTEVTPPEDGLLGVYYYDARTGELLRQIALHQCQFFFAFGGGTYGFTYPYIDSNLPLSPSIGVPPQDPPCETSESFLWWLNDPITGEVIHEEELPKSDRVNGIHDETTWWVQREGRVRLEDFTTGEVLVDLDPGRYWLGDPNGRFVVESNDNDTTSIHDLETGTTLTLRFPVDSVVSNATGDKAYMSSRGVIELIDLETGVTLATVKGHAAVVWPQSPAADDQKLATGSADATIRVWDLGTRGEVGDFDLDSGFYADSGIDTHGTLGVALVYPGESSALFSWISSEMTRAAVGEVVIFDTSTGVVSAVIPGVAGKVARLSPDGSRLAVQTTSASGDLSSVAIFDVSAGALEVELEGICDWSDTEGTLGEEFVDFTGACTFESFPFATDVTDIAWSPDGSLIAATGGWSKRWIVWDTTTGQPVHVGAPGEWAEFSLSAVQFSPSGEIVAVSNKTGTAIYDTSNWARIAFIPHTGTPSWVLRFTPDGRFLVSAQAHTGDVRVFDTSDWDAEPRFLPAGSGQTRDMALSTDGSLIATSSNDGLIHVLSLDSGLAVEVLTIGDVDVTNVEFIDSDERLLVTSSQGPVQILTLDWNELIAIGRSRVVRPFSDEECRTYRIDPCPTLEEIKTGSA